MLESFTVEVYLLVEQKTKKNIYILNQQSRLIICVVHNLFAVLMNPGYFIIIYLFNTFLVYIYVLKKEDILNINIKGCCSHTLKASSKSFYQNVIKNINIVDFNNDCNQSMHLKLSCQQLQSTCSKTKC